MNNNKTIYIYLLEEKDKMVLFNLGHLADGMVEELENGIILMTKQKLVVEDALPFKHH